MRCLICGKDFEPKTYHQVYCSDKCRLGAKRISFPVGVRNPDNIKKDCFAYTEKRCTALKHFYCAVEDCGWYKPKNSGEVGSFAECWYCGKIFKKKHKEDKFCSVECAADNYLSKKARTWINGESRRVKREAKEVRK